MDPCSWKWTCSSSKNIKIRFKKVSKRIFGNLYSNRYLDQAPIKNVLCQGLTPYHAFCPSFLKALAPRSFWIPATPPILPPAALGIDMNTPRPMRNGESYFRLNRLCLLCVLSFPTDWVGSKGSSSIRAGFRMLFQNRFSFPLPLNEKNMPASTECVAGFPKTINRGGRLSFFVGISCSDL